MHSITLAFVGVQVHEIQGESDSLIGHLRMLTSVLPARQNRVC